MLNQWIGLIFVFYFLLIFLGGIVSPYLQTAGSFLMVISAVIVIVYKCKLRG